MRKLPLPAISFALALLTTGFKISDRGENKPTVQSFFGGSHYVRAIPSNDYGDEGRTRVFRVKKDKDELLEEFPVYMRGDVFLGWSPLAGKWVVVHVEPTRITGNDDWLKLGAVSRLAFYMGGMKTQSYSDADLEQMGLKQKVQTLAQKRADNFVVRGIRQIPRTNHYVFVIERTAVNGGDSEEIRFDITTGKKFRNRK